MVVFRLSSGAGNLLELLVGGDSPGVRQKEEQETNVFVFDREGAVKAYLKRSFGMVLFCE